MLEGCWINTLKLELEPLEKNLNNYRKEYCGWTGCVKNGVRTFLVPRNLKEPIYKKQTEIQKELIKLHQLERDWNTKEREYEIIGKLSEIDQGLDLLKKPRENLWDYVFN